MSAAPISIKRYPNRRYYASNTSKYVSLQEIEELVQQGHTVEIRDSQTGDDLTRVVLTQIIMERHPEMMSLFPTAMLHAILRANEVMLGVLRDYFRHSMTYFEYLQRPSTMATALAPPIHWVRAWMDGLAAHHPSDTDSTPAVDSAPLSHRVEQLEARLKQLESKQS